MAAFQFRPLAGSKCPLTTGCYPYLRVANVQAGFLDLQKMETVEALFDELKKYRLQNGDLLLTEGGDWDKLGRSAIWEGAIENCIHQNHAFRARVFHDGIRPEWIRLYTNSPVGREYFQSASKQTTNLASINMTQLRGCPIPLPPTKHQGQVLEKVDQLMTLCDALEAQLARRETSATELLEAMVAAILEGETAVSDPRAKLPACVPTPTTSG
jgi:type I restriction enzyme, S subunit